MMETAASCSIASIRGNQEKGKTKLIRGIIQLQRRVNRALRQDKPDVLMELNLTIAQLKSLFFISREGITNSRKLAQALRVTPSNVTGIVNHLVKRGLVSRQENPEDRRVLLLKSTDKGEALLTSLRESRMGQLSKALSRLSEDQLSTLSQGFRFLAEAAEAGER